MTTGGVSGTESSTAPPSRAALRHPPFLPFVVVGRTRRVSHATPSQCPSRSQPALGTTDTQGFVGCLRHHQPASLRQQHQPRVLRLDTVLPFLGGVVLKSFRTSSLPPLSLGETQAASSEAGGEKKKKRIRVRVFWKEKRKTMLGGGGGGGGGDGESVGGRMAMLAGIPLQMSPGPVGEMVGTSGGGGGGGALLPQQQQQQQPQRGREERMPQWGQQETRDLIAIRADLERDPAVTRRNKTMWEGVAARMRERGYRRTPDQCKCKWKNLVNRYKGKETADPETGRQCPFFDELNAVFVERAKNMQRLLLESESGASQSKKKPKRLGRDRSSDEFSDDDEEEDNDSEEELLPRGRRKKADQRGGHQQHRGKAAAAAAAAGGIQELLQEFLRQQQQMEMQWFEMMERRTRERRMFEQEWRQSMEKLERERLMLEQAWREREEQRRMREESRAEKRDALLTTLLNKLIEDDL
ncbi:hypothetical protein BHE74_00059740 [Ensete ventricosum]|nr:hypothetical protein BHE74_00059740 [Ensete ventricosum]